MKFKVGDIVIVKSESSSGKLKFLGIVTNNSHRGSFPYRVDKVSGTELRFLNYPTFEEEMSLAKDPNKILIELL